MSGHTILRGGLATLILLLAGLGGCAIGQATGLTTPRRDIAEQVTLIRPHTTIELPADTSAPVPAAILLHGCGGLRQVQPDYAAALLEAGYGVITVDSNSARGIGRFAAMSQVCTALRLWGRERAADIEAALVLAREDARIDDSRLALIGWSHGGWTVLDALDYAGEGRVPASLTGVEPPPLAGVRSAILLYPYCGFPVRADGRGFPSDIAVHAILAGRDMVAPTGDCVRLFQRADAAGHPVDYVTWPGVTHAFDEPAAPPDPRMEFDADAAARARARIVDILDRDLRDQG